MSRFERIELRYEALLPRERSLLAATLLLFVLLLPYLLWIEPLREQLRNGRESQANLEVQVQAQRDALARMETELARDPEQQRRAALAALSAELANLEQALRADQTRIIPPARVAGLLRELMGRDQRLRIVGINVLPAQPLLAPQQVAAEGLDAAQAEPPATKLYRHRVLLTFEGDYAAALDYLRAVEALPYHLRMRRFELRVEDWPRLELRLEIESLGLEEGWIGA